MHLHIISRSSAISAGLSRYFTGKPCKRGHIAQRTTKKATCQMCAKECTRRYYLSNRERILSDNRARLEKNKDRYQAAANRWKKENSEKVAEYKRKYYERNRELVISRSSQWQKDNPEKMVKIRADGRVRRRSKDAEYKKKYRAENKGKINAQTAKRFASKRQATPPWSEKEQIELVYQKAQEFGMQVDHIVPIQGETVSGLHCWHNLQLLTAKENQSKSNNYWPDMW